MKARAMGRGGDRQTQDSTGVDGLGRWSQQPTGLAGGHSGRSLLAAVRSLAPEPFYEHEKTLESDGLNV